ncbi:MAG: DUF87 domain-containing protein [Candidatus Stygibacter australis]|nr:DUF87 domain-containing protein [Candidatus Stygibacter australis]
MDSKLIGRIIRVDSFRITIELEQDLKSLYKSGFEDIYEIARTNSYVILPVADEKVVALVTKVMLDSDPELISGSGIITLPKARRYVMATMIGTIRNREFNQGVNNFPILDNPVWYITEKELKLIFDKNDGDSMDLNEFLQSYFLPIGSSPTFNDYTIKVNPDKMFGKHLAILGNTGSGKSCTVSTILQSLFEFNYPENKSLKYGNVIIFDTNGEYSKAFKNHPNVNCLTIASENLKIPYWFMNWNDFEYLFIPQPGTQAPILKRAIEISRENNQTENLDISSFDLNVLNQVRSILINYQLDTSSSRLFMTQNTQNSTLYNEQDRLNGLFNKCEIEFSLDYKDNTIKPQGDYIRNFGFTSQYIEEMISKIDELIDSINSITGLLSKSVDQPIYFPFNKLLNENINKAIEEQERSLNRIREFISPLILRMKSYLTDERFKEPLMLDSETEEYSLDEYMSLIFGKSIKGGANDGNTKHQITILDMSMLASDVLENITGIIGRLILEFLQRIQKASDLPNDDDCYKRGGMPTVIVLEEAQNYIPERNINQDRISISKRVFERIAREGRKYGLGLILSSQRPSELSKTILSQCNTFIVHRIQNPDDQRYIRQIISSANEDLLNQLPILPQQHAIIMGDGVRSPVQIKLRDVNPKPDSSNPEFIKKWLEENKIEFKKVTDNWLGKNIKQNEPPPEEVDSNEDDVPF